MKKIYFILTLMCTICLNAQISNNTENPYVGTWEYQDGNEIFRVFLWMAEDNQHILGHYEKVISNNGIETFVFCSDKEKYEGLNQAWLPYSIYCTIDNQVLGGIIVDNTVNSSMYHFRKNGKIRITLNSDFTNAVWIVQEQNGTKINEAPEFSVPTDIVLTKVE